MPIHKKAVTDIKDPIVDMKNKLNKAKLEKGTFYGRIKMRTILWYTTFANTTKTNILPIKKDT